MGGLGKTSSRLKCGTTFSGDEDRLSRGGDTVVTPGTDVCDLKWVWMTLVRTCFIFLLVDSSFSIVFSIVEIKFFFRSRVILACILLRSRLWKE